MAAALSEVPRGVRVPAPRRACSPPPSSASLATLLRRRRRPPGRRPRRTSPSVTPTPPGVGTRSYIADGTTCQRSTYAYPSLIAAARGYALNFRACSGATIPDVTSTQLGALSAATGYVTISVGGNDAGFADVLTECAQPGWMSDCNGAIDGAQAYINNTLPGALATLYASIRSRGPEREVVVVGYPRIFNGEDCNAGTWFSPGRGDPAQRDRRPAEQQARGGRVGPGLRVREPDQPASSATRSATTSSGSTGCRTRSARATTPTGPATPPATRRW